LETVVSDDRIYMSSEIENEVKFDWTHRFDTFYPEVGWGSVRDSGLPNTALLEGISSANNFDPILPDRYVTWMEAIEILPETQLKNVLRMMGVGWVAELSTSSKEVGYIEIGGSKRFWFAGEAVWVESPERALQQTLQKDFDPDKRVILEGAPISYEDSYPGGSQISIQLGSNPNRLELIVNASEDGWIVISDTYYPGWQARVDGEVVQIYRANYLFRAIRVPVGVHNIEMQYRPATFFVGGALTIGVWIVLGVLWWRLKKD
jgi:hypothetical protein